MHYECVNRAQKEKSSARVRRVKKEAAVRSRRRSKTQTDRHVRATHLFQIAKHGAARYALLAQRRSRRTRAAAICAAAAARTRRGRGCDAPRHAEGATLM